MNIENAFIENKILAPYCTYQIGGSADYFFEANNKNELIDAVLWAKKNNIRYFILGGGSNLLFDDSGFRGLVIRPVLNNLRVEGEKIIAESGVKIFALTKAALDHGLSGLESWNGLPGTVGGAVFGNAGCFGTETKDILESAEIFDDSFDASKKVDADFFEYVYRSSKVKKTPGTVILEATFKLKKVDPNEVKKKMEEVFKLRVGKQPAGSSTGSYFKNPPGEKSAGMLIDAAGLKGKMLGKAQISEQHANFILNKGGAKSKDILELAKIVKDEVYKKFGIKLEEEVIYVV